MLTSSTCFPPSSLSASRITKSSIVRKSVMAPRDPVHLTGQHGAVAASATRTAPGAVAASATRTRVERWPLRPPTYRTTAPEAGAGPLVVLDPVIRCFLGDDDIVRMRLAESRGGDPD